MEDKPVAVVLDSLTSHYRHRIGFSPDEFYFNSGVILFDAENWKSSNATDKIMSTLSSRERKSFINPDQDLLNISLKGQAVILHPRYNFQTTHKVYSNRLFFKHYGKIKYYSGDEIDAARKDPAIIHAYRFLGQFPWHKKALHPYRSVFLTYASISECADFEPLKNVGVAFKFERFLYLILPKCIFIRIFKAWQKRSMKKHFKRIGAQ
jgi:lipopolysaccharide biosynthesis glycosyltransferase